MEPYMSRILSFLSDKQDQGLFSRVTVHVKKLILFFSFLFLFS